MNKRFLWIYNGSSSGQVVRSSLAAWYDATRTPAGIVTSLIDYSNNGNTATQATANDKPVNTANQINGKPALLYDGTTDFLSVAPSTTINNLFATGGTVMFVIKPATVGEAGLGRIIDKGSKTTITLQNVTGSTCELSLFRDFSGGSDGQWRTTNKDITIGAVNIIAVTYDSSSTSNVPVFYVNSTTAKARTTQSSGAGTAVSDASDAMIIGNRVAQDRTFNGLIAEGLLSRKIFTAEELSLQFNFWAAKWGVTLT